MIKDGIFHPQLLKILGELRHMDLLVIGDAGLPIPNGVERIDLGWKKNNPRFKEVLEEILKVLVIEKAIFASEALEKIPEFHKETLNLLPAGLPVEYVKHVEFKDITKGAKAIILTGEFTGYTNIILQSGCSY